MHTGVVQTDRKRFAKAVDCEEKLQLSPFMDILQFIDTIDEG